MLSASPSYHRYSLQSIPLSVRVAIAKVVPSVVLTDREPPPSAALLASSCHCPCWPLVVVSRTILSLSSPLISKSRWLLDLDKIRHAGAWSGHGSIGSSHGGTRSPSSLAGERRSGVQHSSSPRAVVYLYHARDDVSSWCSPATTIPACHTIVLHRQGIKKKGKEWQWR